MCYDSTTGSEIIMLTYLYTGLQDLGWISGKQSRKIFTYCYGTGH